MRGGIIIVVPPDLGLMTPYVLLEQEDWFESEIEFVRRLLLPGMFVIDVGANYGTYTLSAAARVGEQGQVIAFEPASATADYLGRSVAANSFHNVRLFQCALSDRVGKATLSVSANSELNSLRATPGAAGEVVSLRTLDDCFDELGTVSVDFLKLDAEGEETNVVRGGVRLLEAASPLVMFEIKHADRVNLELLERFRRIGYRIYSLIPGLSMLAPFDPAAPLDAFQLNLFAAKNDCATRLEERGLLAQRMDIDLSRAQPDCDSWHSHLENLPYAKRFLAQWRGFRTVERGTLLSLFESLPYTKRFLERRSAAAGGGDPDSITYREALNDYARAYLPQTPDSWRPAFLARSLTTLSMLLDGKPTTFPRLSTWARVAGDAGKRALARKIALGMIEAIDSGQLACDADEPFLSPSKRFDALDPGEESREWYVAGLLETAVRLGHYSSYFSGAATLGYLERLAQSGYQSPEMERRRQLVRIQAGLQRNPEPHPVLEAQSGSNLNPGYWMRGWL